MTEDQEIRLEGREAHDKQLRLECLRMAVAQNNKTVAVVEKAKAFAAFVLGGE